MKIIPGLVLAVLLAHATPSHAQDRCVFAKKSPENAYRAQKAVRTVRWQDETNRASIILKDGSLVSVQHWFCTSSGVQAFMLTNPGAGSDDEAKGRLEQLARLVLPGPELTDLLRQLGTSKPAYELKQDIPGPENRPEFYYVLRRVGEADVFEIKYYYN